MWPIFHKLFLLIIPAMLDRSTTESLSYTVGAPPVNDPRYWLQRPYMEATHVPAAWKRLLSTRVKRHRVTVGIVDSGVQPDHPDLVANLVEGYNVVKKNSDTDDTTGHGTAMAGIIGATINNSIGIAGVMDLVNIMPISVDWGFTERHEYLAADYAIRNKEAKDFKILLMAFSGEEERPLFFKKLKEANNAGILMIVTAGNTGKNTTIEKRFPCALTEQLNGMICVAATEQVEMRLVAESSFANYVDIAAPGFNISTTYLGGQYAAVNGTSSAAAFIAGVAAMLFSLAPDLSSSDAKKILKQTAKKGLKVATGQGPALPFGRVDADAVLPS